jgi:hypothetical protein
MGAWHLSFLRDLYTDFYNGSFPFPPTIYGDSFSLGSLPAFVFFSGEVEPQCHFALYFLMEIVSSCILLVTCTSFEKCLPISLLDHFFLGGV